MQNANKFVLLTERELNEIKVDKYKNTNNSSSPMATEIGRGVGGTPLVGLDAEISHILNDSALSDDVKMKRYTDALTRYRQVTDKNYSEGSVSASTLTSHTKPEEEALLYLPSIQHYRGRRLLRKIKETRLGDWNADGNLVYKQSTVPGSNIADLLGDILQARNSGSTPAGWPQFARLLVDAGVSKELIPNSKRWTYINNLIKHKRTGVETVDGARQSLPARGRGVEGEETEKEGEGEEGEEGEADEEALGYSESFKTPTGGKRVQNTSGSSGRRAKGRKKSNRKKINKKRASPLSPAAADSLAARNWIRF